MILPGNTRIAVFLALVQVLKMTTHDPIFVVGRDLNPAPSPKVTVNARENETISDTCVWDVIFETNTGEEDSGGELPLLTAAFYNVTNSSHTDLGTTGTQVCLLSAK